MTGEAIADFIRSAVLGGLVGAAIRTRVELRSQNMALKALKDQTHISAKVIDKLKADVGRYRDQIRHYIRTQSLPRIQVEDDDMVEHFMRDEMGPQLLPPPIEVVAANVARLVVVPGIWTEADARIHEVLRSFNAILEARVEAASRREQPRPGPTEEENVASPSAWERLRNQP